jgi:cytidyltransferase-like protein
MRTAAKIVSIPLAAQLAAEARVAGVTVGLCHGCFDVLHAGHVHHFDQAARRVDLLIASITPAQYVGKDEGRPIFNDEARLAVVAALAAVDLVLLNDAPTSAGLIRRLRPHLYFKGADYGDRADPRLAEELAALREAGGEFVVTDGRVFDSSTRVARVLLGAGRPGEATRTAG